MSQPKVPPERGFRFQHGPLACSLEEFRIAIAQAPVEVVHYHREHFVPWVRDVLGDEPLARRLEAYAESGAAPDVYREIVVDLVGRRPTSQRSPA
jgi:hypothetical protein